MTVREFNFGFKFSAIDGVSPILKNIEGRIESLNKQVAATARWREAGTNLAMIGGGMVAIGGGIGYALKTAIDKSQELQVGQQRLLTVLDAGAAGQREIAGATELAEKMSVKYNISQEQALENIRLGISGTLTYKQAMDALEPSVQLAKATFGDTADSGRFLATVMVDFGDKTKDAKAQLQQFSDITAYVVRQKAFSDLGEFQNAMDISLGSAKAAGMTYRDTATALAAFSAAGLKGSMAGEALEETLAAVSRGGFEKIGVRIATFKNGAIDAIGTIANLEKKYGASTKTPQLLERLGKALNIRGLRALTVDPDQLLATRKQLADGGMVQGAAAQGADIVMQSATERWGRFTQAIVQLEEVLGNALLPTFTKIADKLTAVALHITEFGKAHPELVKFGAIMAVGAASVLLLGGGLAIASGALMGFVSFLPAVTAFAGAIRLTAVASKMWAAAQWLVNAAMDANPIVLIGAAVVGLGVAVYELYKHWDAVKTFFKGSGGWILTMLGPLGALTKVLIDYGPQMYAAGLNLVKEIGRGIEAGIAWAEKAISHVGSRILSYVKGNSPPPMGPLHQLDRLKLVETIADSMKPHPAIAAMTRVSRAIALAVPLTVAPMLAGPAIASVGTRSSAAAAGGVIVNYSVTVHAAPGQDKELLAVLRQHGRELVEIINRETTHQARRNF